MWKTGIAEEDVVGKEGLQEVFELLGGTFFMVKTPVNHTQKGPSLSSASKERQQEPMAASSPEFIKGTNPNPFANGATASELSARLRMHRCT